MNSVFRLTNAKGTRAEIWLYDQIGSDWWTGEGISANSFRKELSGLGKVDAINLRINSPGGDVFDGITIHNLLAQHPAQIEVDIDGLAASIASVIAMAGDTIRMAANAQMMIHNPVGVAFGDSREMERMQALLAQTKGTLVDTYAARTGASKADLSAWMDEETWFTAADAAQHGFVDEVGAEQKVAASFGLLKHYRHVPKALKARSAAEPSSDAARDIARVRLFHQQRRAAALGA